MDPEIELTGIRKLITRQVRPNRARNFVAEKYKIYEQEGVRYILLRKRQRTERCHAVLQATLGFRRGGLECQVGVEYWLCEAGRVEGLGGQTRNLEQPWVVDFNGWLGGNPLVKSVLRLV